MQAQAQAYPPPLRENRAAPTGADAVIQALSEQGVEVVFGMVGGAIMPVYDALYRAGAPRHIICGHEQGAAHMAEGYARVTGKAGVVFTTSGPGATNLVTGLANAMMDSTPLVALTGQVSSSLLGNDAFQEADMWGITMPITKHNYQVQSVDDLPRVMAEAFRLAQGGRPGPVLIDLPRDIMLAPCPAPEQAAGPPPARRGSGRPRPEQVTRAAELVAAARRPVILAGGGVVHAGAHRELKQLAEALEIPVATTLMGLGCFPAGHRLFLGMPGMHGTGYANLALHHADLILVVGCRLDDRVTGKVERFAPGARMVHLDVDPSEIGKILPAAVGMACDAAAGLRALLEALQGQRPPDHRARWLGRIEQWRRRFPMTYPRRPGVIAPQQVVEELGRRLAPEDVVVTGVGQHQMYAAQYFPFRRPRSLVTSGGLGTMGFGLPAAIGAKLGRPQSRVICIDGDGSFLMTIQELTTAVRYRIGLVVVILNNAFLGMVRQWQDLFLEGRRAQTELDPPPFDQVARAFGGLGRQVQEPDELESALDWALAQAEELSLPVVLDVAVDREALVLPMVPAGGANLEFIPCQDQENESCRN